MVGTTVGYHGKRIKAKVNTRNPLDRFRRQRDELGYASCVPVTCSRLFNPNGLDSAVLVAVKTPHPAELREFDTTRLESCTLSVFEGGAHLMAAFELRVARPLFKEVLKRAIKVFQRPLQTVAVGVVKPLIFGLEFGQLSRLLHIGQTLTRRLVDLLADVPAPSCRQNERATLGKSACALGRD